MSKPFDQISAKAKQYGDQIADKFRQRFGDLLSSQQLERCDQAAVTLAEVGILAPFAADADTVRTLNRRKELALSIVANYAITAQLNAGSALRDIAVEVLTGAVIAAL